jgi:hypothetical protein
MQTYLVIALSWLTGLAPFTERGKTDFDTFLSILQPHGTWMETEPGGARYKFVPSTPKNYVPLSNGRWIYSNYGWYWLGQEAFSAITDHYGYWVYGADQRWSWRPGPDWHSDIVEWRQTPTHLGWRPSALTADGTFVESETERLARPETWIFIPKEKFGRPMTTADVITGEAARTLLAQAQPVYHVFVGYASIDRSGPNPALFRERLGLKIKKEIAPPPVPDLPTVNPEEASLALRKMQDKAKADKASKPEKPVTEMNAEERKEAADQALEKMQLEPIVIMSLPTFDTPPPPTAKPQELYVYRPVLYQDRDGLNRRVKVMLDPTAQKKAREQVVNMVEAETMGKIRAPNATETNAPPADSPAPAPASPKPASRQRTKP